MSKVILELNGAIVVEDLEVKARDLLPFEKVGNKEQHFVEYFQSELTVDFDKVTGVWYEPHISWQAVDKALNIEEV